MIIDAARYSNDILEAFIASEEMDNAARYLQAGRRFADHTDDALNAVWAHSWRASYDENWWGRSEDYIDADAELTLRRLPRPDHLIPPDSRRRVVDCIRALRRQSDTSRELMKRYEDFVQQCAARRN
jgi:hypothetical protein